MDEKYIFPFKFNFASKNKEYYNQLREEIFSYIRNKDNIFSEKISNLQSAIETNIKNIKILETNFEQLLSNQMTASAKIDNLKPLESLINKSNDKLISHEIRINSIRDDLTKSFQKYDKLYLENFEVPGFIGHSSKYPNYRIFFTEIIKEMEKFNKYKDKNTLDLNIYKDKLESMIKTFQTIVENNNNSQIKYISKLNEKSNKNIIDMIDEKIQNVRMENSFFSKNLLKKSEDLNELYNKINIIKDNLFTEFNKKSEMNNAKMEEINNSFNEFKVEYEIIRKKFIELLNFLKKGKFQRYFGASYSRKDLNIISKKLNKDLKDKINPKDVNLLNNIDEIENINFTDKNNIESDTISNSNRTTIKLSKSHNNIFKNNNSSLGSKNKVISFRSNLNKNTNKKNELRLNKASLLNFKTKNMMENNSVKNLHRKNNVIDYLKFNKTNLISIDQPRSERHKDKVIKYFKNFNLSKNPPKLKKEDKNQLNEDLSFSESCLSNNNNINNSINTFSTTNEKSTSNTINVNNNKVTKISIFETELQNTDKIIKEIAPELEQSTAKNNLLASNKKEIEENFKSICNKIQPLNLKLNNLEKIDENENNDINKTKLNNNFNNSIDIKDKINISTTNIDDKKLNNTLDLCHKKLGDLESYTKQNLSELIKQISFLQKNYLFITNYLKLDNKKKPYDGHFINSYDTQELNTIGNENKNSLNIRNNFLKKNVPIIEFNSKLCINPKKFKNEHEINIKDNMTYSGKFYFSAKNIKSKDNPISFK